MGLKETGESEPLFPFVPARLLMVEAAPGPLGQSGFSAGCSWRDAESREGHRRKESSPGIFILTGYIGTRALFLYSGICKSLVYWSQPLRPLFGHSSLLTRAPSRLALVAVCSLCSQHQKLETRCVQAVPGALLAAFNELDHSCLLSQEEPWLVISGTSWAAVNILQSIILMEGPGHILTVQELPCSAST